MPRSAQCVRDGARSGPISALGRDEVLDENQGLKPQLTGSGLPLFSSIMDLVRPVDLTWHVECKD